MGNSGTWRFDQKKNRLIISACKSYQLLVDNWGPIDMKTTVTWLCFFYSKNLVVSHSLKNTACHTCHPRSGFDLIKWPFPNVDEPVMPLLCLYHLDGKTVTVESQNRLWQVWLSNWGCPTEGSMLVLQQFSYQ